MATLHLGERTVYRPEKITWRLSEPNTEPIAHLKSKGLRKFLSRSDELLAQKDITHAYKALSADEFSAWLPYYQEKMSENSYEILATPDWYQDRTAKGLTIEGIFFYQNNKLVGSGIFTRDGLEKATFAFKASDRLDLSNDANSSLGAVIDYFFLKTMIEKGVKIISAGRSRNAFGVINTLGYIDYKLRFGYQPQPDLTSAMFEEVPLNESGVVMFYGMKNDKFTLFGVRPHGSTQQFEASRFATPELPFELIEY